MCTGLLPSMIVGIWDDAAGHLLQLQALPPSCMEGMPAASTSLRDTQVKILYCQPEVTWHQAHRFILLASVAINSVHQLPSS